MKPKRQQYKGHRIELRKQKDKMELYIDDKPMQYGQLTDGTYYLHEYAYDPCDSLEELAKQFIDYQRKTEQARQQNQSDKGEQ